MTNLMVLLVSLSIVSLFAFYLYLLGQIRSLWNVVTFIVLLAPEGSTLRGVAEKLLSHCTNVIEQQQPESGGIITKPTRLLEAGRYIDPPLKSS